MRIESTIMLSFCIRNFLWMDIVRMCLHTPICFKINTFSRWPYDILYAYYANSMRCVCAQKSVYSSTYYKLYICEHNYICSTTHCREKANVKKTCLSGVNMHTIHPVCLYASQPVQHTKFVATYSYHLTAHFICIRYIVSAIFLTLKKVDAGYI